MRLCSVMHVQTGGVCVLEALHGGKHRAAGGERWARVPGEMTVAAADELTGASSGDTGADTGDTPGDTPQQADDEWADNPDIWATTRPEGADELANLALEAAEQADESSQQAGESSREAPQKSDHGLPGGPGGPGTGGGPAGVVSAGGQVRRAYDWPAIRRRYVEGVPDRAAGVTEWPSLDAVAEHFGVVPQRVKEKSSAEGWVEARSRWQAQVERTRQQAKAAAMAREATLLDTAALQASKMGLQLCSAKLTEVGQAAQARRAESVGSGSPSSGIDAQEMQRLAYAVDLWHKIGLRAVGDPETHRVEITGANGKPIEIAQELRRDDPSRLTGVLSVLAQAGLGDIFGGQAGPDAGGDG